MQTSLQVAMQVLQVAAAGRGEFLHVAGKDVMGFP